MKRSSKAVAGGVVAVLVILGVILETGRVFYTWKQKADGSRGYTVVIDPGHGGM